MTPSEMSRVTEAINRAIENMKPDMEREVIGAVIQQMDKRLNGMVDDVLKGIILARIEKMGLKILVEIGTQL